MSNQPTFELRLKLGSGGMGEVWLAKMTLVGSSELVALKRIRSEMSDRPEHLQQFEREARITSLLRHPHIVALRRYGVDGDGPFLALEFVEGRSAKDLEKEAHNRGMVLPVKVALSLARDAARGLSFAHSFRDEQMNVDHIVHRDISPDNVLVSYDGLVKVTDFGIAKVVGGTTLTGTDTARGKYGYMAPELFDGQEADTRSDVFAFGATLFRLLTGTSAFPGKTEAELLRAVLHSQPVRATSLVEVSPAIDEWIDRALAKEPRDRPANLESLLELVEAELASEPGEGRAAVAELMLQCFPIGKDQRRTQVLQMLGAPVAQTHTALKAEKIVFSRRRRWPLFVGAAVGVSLGLAGYLALLATREVKPPLGDSVPAVPDAGTEQVVIVTPVPPVVPVLPVAPAPDAGLRATPVVVREGKGSLFVKASPWAKVTVDGTARGRTPVKVVLPVGEHVVLLDYEEGNVRQRHVVRIERGKEFELKGFLARPP